MAAAMVSLYGEPPRLMEVPCAGRTDRSITRDFFALHNVEDSPERCGHYYDVFVEMLSHYLPQRAGQVLPGVVRILEKLVRDERIQMGLLTGNLRRAARIKLSHYGLDHFFYGAGEAFGGFGDEHADRDDVARDALASAADYVGRAVDPQQVWVVGDTPNDVRCARAIGANVCAVATGHYSTNELAESGPDLVVQTMEEAGAWLAEIGADD